MTRYDHLQLVRLPERFERRKHGGGSPPPDRDLANHSTKLETELDAAVATQQRRRKAEFVDPSLILRVHMSGQLLEEQWEQLGLTVLSSIRHKTEHSAIVAIQARISILHSSSRGSST